MNRLTDLYALLEGDAWRIENHFGEDLLQANALLHNAAATEEEMAKCLALWCQHRQPCQFGKAAAHQRRIHFCFLRDEAVSTWSDEEIAGKIRDEKQLWKQRAACDPERAAHSFVIVVCSPRVALAAPNQRLREFSDRLLELSGWQSERRGARRSNTCTGDFLYLQNPHDRFFYGFRFNVDFFACAGEGRWWNDHRFPGGVALTANSTGHMMRFREWFLGKEDSESWGLKQAMLTIQNSGPITDGNEGDLTKWKGVTWLRPLDLEGKSLIEDVQCPLASVPKSLQGKDWTRYEGLLHTDHAVREEFFLDREIAPTASKPYLMDLTYLYDDGEADFEEFSRGRKFSAEDVYAEIGRPRDWTHRAGTGESCSRSDREAAVVAEQLSACLSWEGSPKHESEGEEEI